MLCSRPRPLNETAPAARLPDAQRERPSRVAGSFCGQTAPSAGQSERPLEASKRPYGLRLEHATNGPSQLPQGDVQPQVAQRRCAKLCRVALSRDLCR